MEPGLFLIATGNVIVPRLVRLIHDQLYQGRFVSVEWRSSIELEIKLQHSAETSTFGRFKVQSLLLARVCLARDLDFPWFEAGGFESVIRNWHAFASFHGCRQKLGLRTYELLVLLRAAAFRGL